MARPGSDPPGRNPVLHSQDVKPRSGLSASLWQPVALRIPPSRLLGCPPADNSRTWPRSVPAIFVPLAGDCGSGRRPGRLAGSLAGYRPSPARSRFGGNLGLDSAGASSE